MAHMADYTSDLPPRDRDPKPLLRSGRAPVKGNSQVRSNGHDQRSTANEIVVPIKFSENSLAYRFSELTANWLVFVHDWGRWMRWSGSLWIEDPAVAVFDQARQICAAAGREAISTLEKVGAKVA